MMTKHGIHRRSMLAGLAAIPFSLSLGRSLAQQTPTAGVPPVETETALTITVAGAGFRTPARVPAGLVTMTLVNEGRANHAAQLLRLDDGVLVSDITAALRDGLEAVFSLASLVGGPGHIAPDEQQTVIQDLAPGNHMVIDTALDRNGVPQFLTSLPQPFEVTERASVGEEPVAAGEVRMADFAFEGLPDELPAGRQLWRVTSDGSEPHELGFRLLDDGATADMVAEMLASGGNGASASPLPGASVRMLAGLPVSPAGGIQAMDPGLAGWMVVDLDPGDYVALSVVPSAANGGRPQAALGMIQGVSVRDS